MMIIRRKSRKKQKKQKQIANSAGSSQASLRVTPCPPAPNHTRGEVIRPPSQYKLSFLDWGILSGLSGSYESLDKEDCSPFIVAKFALSLKSSFSSCMDKKAFETLTE